MSKIIVGNVYNEAMVGNTSGFSRSFRQTAAVEMKRLCWLINSNDVMIVPSPVNSTMLDYISELMGQDISHQNFISPTQDQKNPVIITSEILLNADIVYQLKDIVSSSDTWEIFPYFYNSSISRLYDILDIKKCVENPCFMYEAGADMLNSKSIFRALASEFITIPPGAVCRTERELMYAMDCLLVDGNTVIAKKDKSASGDGNIGIALGDPKRKFAGICDLIKLKNKEQLSYKFVKDIWDRITDSCGNNQVVLEKYYDSIDTLYSEYDLTDNREDIHRITYGKVRMDSSGDKRGQGMANWVGFEMPFNVGKKIQKQFIEQSDKLAQTCHMLGYRGLINFDAVTTKNDEVFFTEINGRLGGCTHIPFILKKLIGNNFMKTHTILTRNRVPIQNLEKVISVSKDICLPDKNNGVVIMNADPEGLGIIEYMVYAKTYAEADSIEKDFLKRI